MKKTLALILILSLPALALRGQASPDPVRALAMSKDDSSFKVYVYKTGVASALAHDHIMGVTSYEGSVDYNPEDPEASKVNLSVEAAELEVLDSALSDEDKAEVKSNMDTKVLHVSEHKTIRFASTRVWLEKKDDAGRPSELRITGDLTLHGQTNKVTLPVALSFEDGKVIAEGKVDVRQSRWGITPYTAFLGAVGVKDVVTVEFRIVSKAK